MIHRVPYDDVGGWDTTFFLDHEDTDLAIRLWQRDWFTVTVPEAKVFHDVGGSNSKVIPNGNIPVGKRRYISASSNQFVVVWKLLSPVFWLMPFLPWLETLMKDVAKMRFKRIGWDILALGRSIVRLPHVFRFRRSNRLVRRQRPAELFFKEKILQFGSLAKPPIGFPMKEDGTSGVRISVALVTRNRPSSLERALRSWRRQSIQPFEVVISDDSDLEQASSVEQLAAIYDCRYIRGPRKGLYANRNHIVEFCYGTHILSADDDHEHPSNFVEAITRMVQEEPHTIFCMGELYSWEDFQNRVPWYGPGQINPHGSLSPVSVNDRRPCWAISDGATLYPRGVFDAGLRFYDGINFGDSYKEFGCLLFKAGWRTKVLDITGVIHHLAELGRSYNNKIEGQASTFFAMFMFSFYYQPSFRNVIVTTSKIGLLLLQYPLDGFCVLSRAFRYYRQRKKQVRSWCLGVRANPQPVASDRLRVFR
jgi:GT2 family glycosyltransferase